MNTLGPYELNQIYTGDARELGQGIPDASVDLIYTDPPYLKEYLYLYAWLGEWAARVLKPDGFLLVYAGNYWKDKVMGHLGAHLEYFWDFTLLMDDSSVMWQRKVLARAKSILAYRPDNGTGKPRVNVLGFWDSGKQDKRYHDWGQCAETDRYYIDCFTAPGQIVIDPFAGGGTTAVVCERLLRPFVSFEIEPETADIARARLSGRALEPTAGLPLFGKVQP